MIRKKIFSGNVSSFGEVWSQQESTMTRLDIDKGPYKRIWKKKMWSGEDSLRFEVCSLKPRDAWYFQNLEEGLSPEALCIPVHCENILCNVSSPRKERFIWKDCSFFFTHHTCISSLKHYNITIHLSSLKHIFSLRIYKFITSSKN